MCSICAPALKYFLIFIIWLCSAWYGFYGAGMTNIFHGLGQVSPYMPALSLAFLWTILVLHATFHTKLLILYFDKDKDSPPFNLSDKWVKFFIFFHTLIFLLSMVMICSTSGKWVVTGVFYLIYSLIILILFIFEDRKKMNLATKFLSYLTFYPLMVMLSVSVLALLIFGANSIFHFLPK